MDEDLKNLFEQGKKFEKKYKIKPEEVRINYNAEGLKPEEITRLVEKEGFKRVGKCCSEPGKVKIGAVKEGEENGVRISYLLFSEPTTEEYYKSFQKNNKLSR